MTRFTEFDRVDDEDRAVMFKSATGEAVIRRLCAEQFGLISLDQLCAAGLTRQAVHKRTLAGSLVPYLPRVFRLGGSPRHELQPVVGVWLWAGDGSVISHTTAAAMRGLSGFDLDPVHVSAIDPHRARGSVRFACTHQFDEQLMKEITEVRGIPITSPRRTLLDLAAVRHPRVEKALDEMLRTGMVTLADVWELLDQPPMWRRRGTRILKNHLAVRSADHAPTHSEMEDLYWRIVRAYRLPHPRNQYRIELADRTVHADFAYPEALLAIECDGYAWHMDRAAFEADRERDHELQAKGWLVLRLTWSMLRWRQDYVANLVRTHHAILTGVNLRLT